MSRERTGVTISDGILLFYLFTLIHTSLDFMGQKHRFESCRKPIHLWLLVSYVSLVGLRVPHYLRHYWGPDTPDSEQAQVGSAKGTVHRLGKWCLMIVWFLLLPFFMVWTVVGSSWLIEVMEHTPLCLPANTDARFIIFWQVVCYSWIVIYNVCVFIALRARWRQYQAEWNYHEIEDDDVRSRWGSMSAAWTCDESTAFGLSAMEISALPSSESVCRYHECPFDEFECSICLATLGEGDAIRQLPGCGHHFHKACIDLWLLRQNKCPLCKSDVVSKTIQV